jgi:predicted Zn-dependent protease
MASLQDVVHLLDVARKQGARGAEILLAEGEGVAIEVAKGKVVKTEPHQDARVTVRCWSDTGGEGVATADAWAAAPLLVEKALGIAQRAVPDPNSGPQQRLSQAAGGLGIDDKRHGQLTLVDRTDVVLSAEKGARTADRRVRTEGFRYVDRRARRAFANTRGLALEEWSTTYRATGTVIVSDERGEIALHEHLASRAFASIASLPYGQSLAHRAIALVGTPMPVEGPMRVLLPPRVLAGIFARLGPLFTVEAVRDRRSFLAVAQEQSDEPDPDDLRLPGHPILDPRLHLLDDGTVPGSLRTRAFDDRGVTPVPLTLLREGKLDARYLDPSTARSLDTRATGHAWEDGLAPNNLILRAGTRSATAILSEIDTPVVQVDDLFDWSGFDLLTGRFRAPFGGHLSRKAQLQGPVRGILEGNLLDVFNRVVEVAADTDRQLHVDAPALLVDGFTIRRG